MGSLRNVINISDNCNMHNNQIWSEKLNVVIAKSFLLSKNFFARVTLIGLMTRSRNKF